MGLTKPLIDHQQEGVPKVVELMDAYDLIREDVDSIMDVTKWSNNRDPMSRIDSKVKLYSGDLSRNVIQTYEYFI